MSLNLCEEVSSKKSRGAMEGTCIEFLTINSDVNMAANDQLSHRHDEINSTSTIFRIFFWLTTNVCCGRRLISLALLHFHLIHIFFIKWVKVDCELPEEKPSLCRFNRHAFLM